MKKTIFFLFCLLTYCSQVIATDCNSCDSCETALNVVGADTVVLTTDILFNGTNDFSGCSGSAFSGGNSIVNDNLIISG